MNDNENTNPIPIAENENPYLHMYERLRKSSPEIPQKHKMTGIFLTVLFDIFSIATLWLFTNQFFSIFYGEFTAINPFIIVGNMINLPVSVIIIIVSRHLFEQETFFSVVLLVLFFLINCLFIIVAFFVPISFIWILPVMIILVLTTWITIKGSFSPLKKLILIIIAIFVLGCGLLNSAKVYTLKNTVSAFTEVVLYLHS